MLVWTFVTATSLGTLVAGGIIRSSSSSIDFSQRLTREPDSYDGVSNAVDKLTSLSLVPEVAGLDFDPKNYADADMWNLYADVKGEHLVCLMQATDKGAGFLIEDKRTPPSAASPWTGDLKNELATWFWHDTAWDKGWECDWERIGLGKAFAALGLNAKPAYKDNRSPADGHNDCLSINHYDKEDYEDPEALWPQMKDVEDQKYHVGGKEYMATGGYYQFSVNKIDGAIIAININSPASAADEPWNWGRKAAPEELPDLRFCSDIIWAYWVRDNPNVKNLRVYGASLVVNDQTVLLVARAFKNVGVRSLAPWPGTSFSWDTEEGIALIGSPIGATIAHMLIRHKAELGIKQISKVNVVTNDFGRKSRLGEKPRKDLHLFFEIEDVPADQVTTDPPEQQKRDSVQKGIEIFESKVLHMNKNGTNIIREHMMRI